MDTKTSVTSIISAFKMHIDSFAHGELPVMDGHTSTSKVMKWELPASLDEILSFSKINGWHLPDDLIEFYLIHNGACLYQHPRYGGGSEILSLEKINLIKLEVGNLPSSWYPIIWTDHTIGSICIDSEKCKDNNYPYLYFLDAMNNSDEAIPINSDFTTLLSRLIACQGAEFWLWDYYDKLTFRNQ